MSTELEDAVEVEARILEIRSLTPSTHHWRVEVENTFGWYTLVVSLRNNSFWKRAWSGDVWSENYMIERNDDPAEFSFWVTTGALKVIEERRSKLGYHGTEWDKLAKQMEDRLNGRT